MEPDPDELAHPGQEDLQWGSGVTDEERRKRNAPSAKYSKISEQARKLIAGEGQCAMFCGGKKCKYCTVEYWKSEQMVITGLYSEWVTDNILAMARPSNYGFDKNNILEQFIKNNVKTVINLQQPGEHASCGYGNDSSGFSYNPQRLMDKQIFFYNFAWQDYGIAPMSTILDIVKVMQFSVANGKVAVHCHAGLGRTGLLIACYLVFNNRMAAADAVRYVRSRRAGAIQTSQQVQTVLDFETHLRPFRTVFPSKLPGQSEVSFKHFLNRQSHLLHGYEARRLKHIPKVVYICCERLLSLGGEPSSKDQTPSPSLLETPPIPSSMLQPVHGKSPSSECLEVPTLGFSKMGVHSAYNLTELTVPRKPSPTSICLEDLSNSRFKKILSEDHCDEDSSSSSISQDIATTPKNANSRLATSTRISRAQSLKIQNMDGSIKVTGSRSGNGIQSDAHDSEEEEDNDDDGIVFGKADAPLRKDQSQHEGQCLNVLNDVQSDQSSEIDTARWLPATEGKSLDGNDDRVTENDRSSSTDLGSRGKRKGKRKGLGQRLKNHMKKTEGKSSPVDVTDLDDRSSSLGQGMVQSCAASDSSSVVSGAMVLLEAGFPSQVVPMKGNLTAVCKVMASTEFPSNVRSKADSIEVQLNEADSAWALLAEEQDPCVVTAVLWDWLNQLKEPVLRKQDLVYILDRMESPKLCLKHLEKSIKHFMEYLALVVSKMFPQSEELEARLVQTLLSHLTHQAVTLSNTGQPSLPLHWNEMRSSEATKLVEFFFELIDEIASPSQTEQAL